MSTINKINTKQFTYIPLPEGEIRLPGINRENLGFKSYVPNPPGYYRRNSVIDNLTKKIIGFFNNKETELPQQRQFDILKKTFNENIANGPNLNIIG